MDERIMNEEIIEVTELEPSSGSGIGSKLIGVAIVAGIVVAGYKFIKKLKAKKNAEMDVDATEDDVIDFEEVAELNKKLN